jgi:hypothetical protein
MILWRAWHPRNNIIHHEGKESIEHSVAFLESYDGAIQPSTIGSGDTKGKRPMFDSVKRLTEDASQGASTSWCPPPKDWLKLNTDASFIETDKPGGAGSIIRYYKVTRQYPSALMLKTLKPRVPFLASSCSRIITKTT